jgi:hypothetical protein
MSNTPNTAFLSLNELNAVEEKSPNRGERTYETPASLGGRDSRFISSPEAIGRLRSVCEDPVAGMAIYESVEQCRVAIETVVARCQASAQIIDTLGCIPALSYIAEATEEIDGIGDRLRWLLEAIPVATSSSDISAEGSELVSVVSELRFRSAQAAGTLSSCHSLLRLLNSKANRMIGLEGLPAVVTKLRDALDAAYEFDAHVAFLDTAQPRGLDHVGGTWLVTGSRRSEEGQEQ